MGGNPLTEGGCEGNATSRGVEEIPAALRPKKQTTRHKLRYSAEVQVR
jgi:hypothetical protein